MPGILKVLFYLIPDGAVEQILVALHQAGYTPEWRHAQDAESLLSELEQAPQVILAGLFGAAQAALEAQQTVRAHQLTIPVIAVADAGSQAMVFECLQQGVADCVNMEYLRCLAPAVMRALRYQQLEQGKHQAEDTLRQQHELLNQITDTVPAGIMVNNLQGQITFANAYAQKTLGLAQEKIDQRQYNVSDWQGFDLDGKPIPEDQRPVRQVMTTARPVYGARYAIQRPGQPRIIISVNTVPVFSPQGTLESIVSSVEDIGEQVMAQQAHIESEERYRRLVELSPDAIAVHSEGRFVYVNPAGVRLFGAQNPEELLGRPIMDIIHPDYQRLVGERVQRGLISESALPLMEEKFVRLDGSAIDVEVASMPLTFAGQPAIQVIARDITQRKLTERALQAILKGTAVVGEAFFRSLVLELASALQVRFAAVGLLIPGDPYRIRTVAMCADGRIIDNIEYDLVSASYDQANGNQTVNISPFFFPNSVRQIFPKAHVLVKMGAESYLGVPLFSSSGVGLGHIAVIDDQPMRAADLANSLLTIFAARAGAELERLEAEEKYLSIIENVSEGIFQSTPEGIFLLANTPLARMLGYKSADELLKHVTDIPLQLYVEPEDRFVWQEALKKHDIIQGFEVQLYKRDGSKFWISQNVHAVRDQDGNLLYYEGTVMDITSRREAEETIRQNTSRTQALDAVSKALTESGLDYHAMLHAVAQHISEIIGDLCVITLLAPESQVIEVAALHHPDSRLRQEAAELYQRVPQKTDEGLSGRVLSSGRALIVACQDAETRQTTPPEYLEFTDRHNFQSAIGAPIRAHNHIYGALLIYRNRNKPAFCAEDSRLLDELSNRTGMAISNARLLAETERRLRYVQALRDIDVAITSSLELSVTLNIVLEHVTAQLETDTAAILLLNPHLNSLNYAAGRGFHTSAIQHTRLRLGESYAGRAALQRQTIGVPSLNDDPLGAALKAQFPMEDFEAFYGTPLLAKGQVKGVLEVFHRSPLQPDEEWINYFETLARQAAIAIDNANLFTELQRSNTDLILAYDATIEGWSRALDLRDRETEGHTQRVTRLTEQLARRLNVPDTQLVHIRRGALLHDIGKMGVPDRILHKNAELAEDEREVMNKHPHYAFEMLLPIHYLRPALDIPYSHHERWDGQGYPRRLKGEQIPLAARIFAVVDVWDALTSDRPYRPAWADEQALEYLSAGSGTLFDPHVVDEFLRMMTETPDNKPTGD